ncbi:bacteriocin biosynthesis protein [Acetobacter senegalensis]|uniref:Bacteriocin biosynthesis protein n=1 Tax=Acetobacter senegalensis TaxID=446692 RepID=A0A149U1I7_9PROT|nr:CvpA family protein [Acetobacter senegalensis]KXV59227.1 bacteriocin biosynthesis protein [Acetobacter senegalensis]
MAPIDILSLVLVGLSTLHGFWRGFTRQALGLGGWIVAILLACRYYGAVIPLTRPYISNHLAADLAAFGILLLALLIVAALLSSALVRLVQVTALNGLDRTLGAGFGILRGVLLVVLLFLAAQWLLLPEDMQTLEQNGKLTPYIRLGAAYIQPYLPDFGTKGVAPTRSTGHDATL